MLFIPLKIFNLYLHPANIGMAILPFLYFCKNKKVLHLTIGMIFSGMYFIATKEVFDFNFIEISYSLLIFSIFYFILTNKIGKKEDITFLNYETIIISTILIITIIIYRYSYYSMIEIPNDERSLIINNIEIHHINLGIIFLIVIEFYKKYIIKLSRLFYITILSISVGTILDQSTYCLLENVTDEAYGDIFSTIGAIILPVIFIAILTFTNNKSITITRRETS